MIPNLKIKKGTIKTDDGIVHRWAIVDNTFAPKITTEDATYEVISTEFTVDKEGNLSYGIIGKKIEEV